MRGLWSWFLSVPSSGILSPMMRSRRWVQVIGGVALMNLVVGAVWTYPRWQTVEPEREEAQRIAEAVELVGPALARARETYACILKAEKDLKTLQELVATRSGTTAEAVEVIRRMVDQVGLEAGRVTRQAEPIDELGLLELQTKLPVTGSYAAVRELIAALGSEGPFVAIDRIALDAPEESPDGGSLAVELALSTFVVESSRRPPAGSAGNPGGMDGEPVDNGDLHATIDDPWAVVEEIREELSSLPPLPVPPERYRMGLSGLQQRPTQRATVSRNLFAFHSEASADAGPDQSQAPTEPAMPTPPSRSPEVPRISYRLIGILEMANGRRATFKDSNGLYVVGVGEHLPGDVEVVSLGVDYAELEVRGVRIRLTLESVIP